MLKLLTKNTFLLLYFTTEDMKFLKMEKKGERFIKTQLLLKDPKNLSAIEPN